MVWAALYSGPPVELSEAAPTVPRDGGSHCNRNASLYLASYTALVEGSSRRTAAQSAPPIGGMVGRGCKVEAGRRRMRWCARGQPAAPAGTLFTGYAAPQRFPNFVPAPCFTQRVEVYGLTEGSACSNVQFLEQL